MTIARRIKQFMDRQGVEFDIVEHRSTPTSTKTAEASHISGNCIAKGVVLKDERGYALAVVPASRHVRLNALAAWLNRNFALATEDELGEIFVDCNLGAVPVVGEAYGVETLLDDTLSTAEDVYFEGGDHKSLLHLKGATFRRLMENAEHGKFSTAA